MVDITSLNSTAANVVTNSIDAGAMLMILMFILAAAAFFILIGSLEKYTKFFDTLYKLLYTLKYTAAGVGVVTIVYGMYMVCSLLVRVGGGIEPILIVEWFGAYIGITIVGYAATKLWMRIKDMHARYVASKVGI
jgi:hypothetical protein